MSGGSDEPSGGQAESAALVNQINANTELEPAVKAQLLAQAKGVKFDNIVDTFAGGAFGSTKSQSVEDINAISQDFQTKAAARTKLLLQNRAQLATQYDALSATPGSKQTTNITALMQNNNPINLTGQS